MPLLILLAVASILCGPIALILGVVALKRIESLRRGLREKVLPLPAQTVPQPHSTAEAPRSGGTVESERSREVAAVAAEAILASSTEERATDVPDRRQLPFAVATRRIEPTASAIGLEQQIGTRWVLIAGVVTVIFAVGFFLKYAYENEWIGPLGRIAISGLAGLIAVGGGELTRRRGYEIAAKGVAALGFAILYATVFAAHRWYDLIGSTPAYALAIGITATAMLYAVVVDEVVVAVLALVGGFVTPVVLSRGENLPNLLFGYVLVLSAGATLCAHSRKWSIVNVLSLLGTYALYTGWFERFYRPAMQAASSPAQLGVAVFWLAVFFAVYLILPVLHTLLKRVRSNVQDTILVLADAGIAFYYLWTMLTPQYEKWLALGSLIMGVAYLVLTGLVFLRCRADRDLRNALLVAGLALVTLAVPLYLEMHAVAMVWAVEAVGLTVAGLRYRNTLVQLAGGAVFGLALGNLVCDLPLHASSFRLFFNPAFGAWAFVAAALLAGHFLYRTDRRLDAHIRQMIAQALYAVGLLVLMAAIIMELWYHDKLNPLAAAGPTFYDQMPIVFAIFLLLFVSGPLPPRGPLCPTVATALGFIASVTLALTYPHFHSGTLTIFVNTSFARALVLVVAVFVATWLLRRRGSRLQEEWAASAVLALTGILLLWILTTEEIWFHYSRTRSTPEWRFLAQMFISVAWTTYATTLMIVGFWRRIRVLRYVALGIFLLLLAKIFLMDTRTVETIYRIAGFLVTGLALVAVSYLYQYLKKKGFFEAVLTNKGTQG